MINRSVEAESRGYLEYYGQLRQAALSDEELFNAMVDRYRTGSAGSNSSYWGF
ncbi:MAG TPA: hypothetical protein VGI58_17690 [Streptosporangiaceae bacterium]